jgi:hypothetical protein
MDKTKFGGILCSTCGTPSPAVRVEFIDGGSISQCPRCVKIAELMEQLIRKQMRENSLDQAAAV